MTRLFWFAFLGLILSPTLAPAADPKLEDLLGKWVLTDDAHLPKGSIFEFKPDNKLVVTVMAGGEKKTIELAYELKVQQKQLTFIVNGKPDTTAIVVLTKTELVCKDKDGTTPKFKRLQ